MMNNKLTRIVLVEKYPAKLIEIKIISACSKEFPDLRWWYAGYIGNSFIVSKCIEEEFKNSFKLAIWLDTYDFSCFYSLKEHSYSEGSLIILKEHCIKL